MQKFLLFGNLVFSGVPVFKGAQCDVSSPLWPDHENFLPWAPLPLDPATAVRGSRSARSPCASLCQILNTPLLVFDTESRLTST